MTLKQLREHAVSATLFEPVTLMQAIRRLGFVQADPIRSPARAQDLILRHRVTGYHAGDLENRYPTLALEEDFLYAYGFVPRATWQMLHPRMPAKLTALEKRVLEIVVSHRQIHPRELETYIGRKREINPWGGYSKTTTRVLQHLHYWGLLRVARRENGIRLYEPAAAQAESVDPITRLAQLILVTARLLAPVPDRSLRGALQLLAHAVPHVERRHAIMTSLIDSGELAHATVDGVRYLWPAGRVRRKRAEPQVRFLAPFDPVVWDRRRFELLWGWAYRFEAYTPPSKRKLGYYAMPLLWLNDVIGWVNIASDGTDLTVESGFVKQRPAEAAFKTEYEAEVERFREFLLHR